MSSLPLSLATSIRLAVKPDRGVQLASDTAAGERGVGNQLQAFARVVIDHCEDVEPSATKSRLQRFDGPHGMAIGSRVPVARLRSPIASPQVLPRG